MKARIGVADASKVIEVEVDDAAAFRKEIEAAIASSQEVYWFVDVKRRSVGIPVARIAYVEIDPEDGGRTVGFSPGG
jgi:hypothetical protein